MFICSRKLKPVTYQQSTPAYRHHDNSCQGLLEPFPQGNMIQVQSNADAYKSLGNQVESANRPPAYGMYENTKGSDTSGSVKYYVLEDAGQLTA